MLYQNISRLESLALLNIWLTADLGLSDFSDSGAQSLGGRSKICALSAGNAYA